MDIDIYFDYIRKQYKTFLSYVPYTKKCQDIIRAKRKHPDISEDTLIDNMVKSGMINKSMLLHFQDEVSAAVFVYPLNNRASRKNAPVVHTL